LEKELGVPVKVVVGKDYAATMADIGENRAQLAYLTPTTYPKAEKQHPSAGIRPIVKFKKSGKATYRCCVIVRSESSIPSLQALKGKTFAFGSKDSTSSHLMPRSMLIGAGVDIDTDLVAYKYTGSHTNVANAVAVGMLEAGGVKESVAEKFAKQGRVRILAKSGDIPQFPICVNKHLSQEMTAKIVDALLKLDDQTPEHKAVLTAINEKFTGSEKAESSNYDIVRDMIQKIYGDSFYN
jgi:phosphonate transport system substrate-binding protein